MKRQCEAQSQDAPVSKARRTEPATGSGSCEGIEDEERTKETIASLVTRIAALEKQVALITERERAASRGRCDECGKVHPRRRLHNTRGTASMDLCDVCYQALDPRRERVCVCDWDDDPRSCTCFETIDELC
jgi:hypothetical protein